MTKKMKIFIYLILIIFTLIISLFFYFYLNKNNNISKTKIISNELEKIDYKKDLIDLKQTKNTEIEDENNSKNDSEKKVIDIEKKQKIEILKKRFNLKGIIAKGDDFFQSNQYIQALNEYTKALRQSPNDHQIIKKIALVYFELKRYENSVKYFEQIINYLSKEEIEKYILSLIYNTDLKSKDQIQETVKKIKSLNIDNDEKFYYINRINCSIDFHKCKKLYEQYINQKEITFNKLLDIKNALISFKNFGSEELYYKNSLIIGALFKGGVYNISSKLGIDLLNSKPDYKPILLIVGKGFYELGNINESKKYLEIYYNLEPNDLNVTYLLGNINFKLKDYTTSNLYYNSALRNGYKNTLDLKRKLVYNYYLLGDKRGMLNIFSYLIEEKDANINDFSLAIYHAILEKRILNAIKWAETGLEKFKNTNGYEIFYGYLGWIYREENDLEKAGDFIAKGLKINPKNPLITLNAGYLEEAKQNYNLALIYFKRTVNINGDGEFGELAKNEIEQIEKYLKLINK